MSWWRRTGSSLDHERMTREAGCISVGRDKHLGCNVIARFSGKTL